MSFHTFQPRPLEMVKSDTCLSDADKNFHEIEMTGGKIGAAGKGGILDTHDSTIHSGHFMVSHVHDELGSDSDTDDALPPLPTVKSPDVAQGPKFGYDFNKAEQETAESYNFHPTTTEALSASNLNEAFNLEDEKEDLDKKPREVVDASLSRLFECMTLAYSKLTSPRWKTFKGMKVNVKDKIRLNNIIWREWHQQYIKGNPPFICQFAAPLSDDVHTRPESVVLEGKYWKRRLESVTSEYQKWRNYYRQRLKTRPDDQMEIEMTNAQLLDRLATQDTRRIPMQRSPTPAMMDEDFLMDLAADNFFATLTNQPFMFPMAKDIGPLGNADFIQPGLFPLQPNIEDFMDTMDAEMLTGSLSSAASFVKSEPNLSAATSDYPPNKPGEAMFPASSLTSLDLTQIMPQPSDPSRSVFQPPRSPSVPRPAPRTPSPMVTAPLPPSTSSGESSRSTKTLQSLLYPNLPQQQKQQNKDSLLRPGLLPHVPQIQQQNVVQQQQNIVQQQQNIVQQSVVRQNVQQQNTAQRNMQQPNIVQQVANTVGMKGNGVMTSGRGLVASERPLVTSSSLGQCVQTQNLQTRLIPQTTPLVTQIPKPIQVQQVQQIQTQNFAQTLSTVQLSGETLYLGGNPPVLLQQSQLSSLLPQKQVRMVPQGSTLGAVKLEPDIVLPFQVQTGNGNVIIPVHEPAAQPLAQPAPALSTVQQVVTTTTGSILVQQLLAKSNVNMAVDQNSFAVPKSSKSKRIVRKNRIIAPAVTSTVTQVTSPLSAPSPAPAPSPSSQSTYLAQLLRRNTHPTLPARNPGDLVLQDPPNVEVNEFQKGLVMAAASKAAFGTIPFQTSQSQPSTPYSLNQSLLAAGILTQSESDSFLIDQSEPGSVFPSQSKTSGGFNILSPPSTMPRDPVKLSDSPTDGLSGSSSDPNLLGRFQPKFEEREKYQERRRVCHISAEQKRRSSIKNGFDMLHILIPSIAKSQNSKISKATMLQKTGEYLRQLKEERAAMQAEEDMLRQNIDSLNMQINECQSQLPATGAPVTRQREDQLKNAFDDYVRTRTMQNWKFWIFSTIFQDLFTSFNSMVSTASVDELCRTILAWLDQHCSLIALRPVALASLCNLSKTTSILSDPARVPQQAAEAVRRRDSDPGQRR